MIKRHPSKCGKSSLHFNVSQHGGSGFQPLISAAGCRRHFETNCKVIMKDADKKSTDTRYVVTSFNFAANKIQLYRLLAMSWKRSSFQMDKLCKTNGIRYFHFLQPNQYVNGSKPLSTKEKKIAINFNSPYFKHATKGYPVLLKYGSELYHQGVRFYDLTMIYSKIEKTLYRDDCCHVNKAGYDIVARRIDDVIIQNYKKDTNTNKL